MNKEFKVGDLVYYPEISTKVLELTKNPSDSSLDSYPLMVTVGGYVDMFTTDGKHSLIAERPTIFHATPETHELLEKLYGEEFESPPVKPTGKDIIRAMLARGDKAVLCWVSDTNKHPTSSNPIALITEVSKAAVYVKEPDGTMWQHATPFDPRTLEPITELPT